MNFSIAVLGILWLALPSASASAADTLSTLLTGVSEAERLATPLRADATAEIDNVKGQTQDHVVMIERSADGKTPERQVYVQFEKAKVKLLVLSASEIHLAADGKGKKAAADAAVDSTSWTAEDFLPFSPSRCAAMRIADLNTEKITLVCEPNHKLSQYSLMVYKFDRQKSAIEQVLLYKDSMTNLVKMLRNDDFEQIGSKWRPKRVVMQDFKLRTKDTFEIRWREVPSVPPEVFDPKSFAAAAPLQEAAATP